jgi:hypothetical protein
MSILKSLNDNGLWEKVKAEEPFVFRSADLPEVSWDSVLALIDGDLRIGKKLGQGEKAIYNEFGFKVLKADRIELINKEITSLEPFFDFSEDFIQSPRSAHQLYVSLTTDVKSYGVPHTDPENVFFWQLQGKANWKIWSKDKSTVEVDEILERGDFIYCPPNRQHHIIAITPRCGISIGFGKLKG